MTSGHKRWFWLILFLAFIVRVIGIGYGLPYLYHQDEPMMVNCGMALGSGDWNTHYFVIPPFVSTFLFLIYGVYFLLGSLAGVFNGMNGFLRQFIEDPTVFYWLGRFFIGVLFGTATVAAVYKTGERFISRPAGVWAALFLALLPIHVQHSHYIYADIPLTLALTLILYRLFAILDEPSTRNYVLLGLLFGWAMGIKYTVAYFFPAIVAAHLLSPQRVLGFDGLRKVIVSAAVALVAFAAIAPYTFLDWASFWQTFQTQSAAETVTGVFHHFFYSILGGTGFLFMGFAFLGAAVLYSGRKKMALVMLTAIVAYYGVSMFFAQHFARYMIPLTPFLVLLAGAGFERVRQSVTRTWCTVALVAVLLTLTVPTFYSDYLFTREDTRTQALRWFEENVPAGSVIVRDNVFFSPRLLQTAGQIEDKIHALSADQSVKMKKLATERDISALSPKKAYKVYLLWRPKDPEPLTSVSKPIVHPDWSDLRKVGAEYLVFNDKDSPHEYRTLIQPENLERVAVFTPYRNPDMVRLYDLYDSTGAPHLLSEAVVRARLGPRLQVYRVRNHE